MNILITGANGFVGGQLWRACRAAGWNTRALGRRPVPGASDYLQHDLRNPLPPPPGFRPDVIVHAAARSSPWGRQSDFEADNVIATRHMLDFGRVHGCPHFIHISTAAVLYRPEHQVDLAEDAPLPHPAINTYAATKQAAESLVRDYPGPWTILRPRAVFGPGDTVLFPRILRAARARRLPRIESTDTVCCDLIYIDTLVDYVLRAATRRAIGVFHLTNGEPVELWPTLDRIFADLRIPLPRRCWSVRKAFRVARALELIHGALPFLGEPPLTCFGVAVFAYTKTLNATRCLAELGPPSVSLETGLRRFIDWQRTQP